MDTAHDLPAHDPLVEELTGIVGAEHVLSAAELCAPYETDWTRRFSGAARLVVRPRDTAEVAAVVRACAGAGVAIVPQGGNTGLVGGSVPRGGEVVLSLQRLDTIEPVDVAAAQVTAGAGVTLEALQAHVRAAALDYPIDLASRGSATVGGMIATNAGGARVIRHGMTRAQVLGVEAVLADGTVVSRLTGLVKDNTGYDLAALLVGSEGTLGVVTRARLRLVPLLPVRAVALVGVASTAAALTVLADLQRRLDRIEAAEVWYAEGMALVHAHANLATPMDAEWPCYVLIECADRVDRADPALALAKALQAAPGVGAVVLATDPAQRARLWRYREGHTDAINAAGVPHKLDVTVPLARFAEFEVQVRGAVAAAAPAARTVLFGHLGDGNLHVNVLGPAADDERADEAVLQLVAAFGGSISAEHGIGRAKARWLSLTRSPAEVATMRAIKRALDPAGLLNPGVLWPVDR